MTETEIRKKMLEARHEASLWTNERCLKSKYTLIPLEIFKKNKMRIRNEKTHENF